MIVYYPEYQPKVPHRFDRMVHAFQWAETKDLLKTLSLMYLMDASYDRQDLLVALTRREREIEALAGAKKVL